MKVLVTGAAGFVGRHVVAELLGETTWKIVAVDRNVSHSYRESPRLRVVRDDLSESTMTTPWCEDVDVVINLASSSDVPAFLDNPTKHTVNNVLSTLNLLEWARYQKLKAFIQVSTNEVYGPQRTSTALSVEWDPLVPETPYSASKAAQEMLAIGWRQTYGVPVAIVNTMHVFGEGQPLQRFIPTAINKILDGDPVPIYHRQAPKYIPSLLTDARYGSQVRNWTYAGDLARALIWMISEENFFERLDRWNVAGQEESCLAIVRMLAIMLERSFTVEWVDGSHRPGHDYRYALSRAKLRDEGFVEPYGLLVGLQRTVAWMIERKKLEA